MIFFPRILNRIQQNLKMPFYTKQQSYEVNYLVKVTNIAEREQKMTLIIPALKDNGDQTSDIRHQFNLAVEVKHEERFGNQYAVLNRDLVPQQTIELKEAARVTVNPVHSNIKGDLKISDYDQNQEEYQKYIKSDAFLDSGDSETRKIGDNIIKGEKSVIKMAKKLYNYVIKRLNYGDPYLGLYTAKEALERNKCDCGGFSSLLGALYKSVGLPARIVSGFWAGYSNNTMHAWLEFLTPDNKWIPVDPAIDHLARHSRTQKSGGFGVIGSDRIITSKGQGMELAINGQKIVTDILQNPIVVAEQGDDSYKMEFEFKTTGEIN